MKRSRSVHITQKLEPNPKRASHTLRVVSAPGLWHTANRRPAQSPVKLTIAGFMVLTALAAASLCPAQTPRPPSNLRVTCTEKILEIAWDSVPGVEGYNVYTSPTPGVPLSRRRRVNQALIRSGTRFSYIWDVENGERVRGIKGRLHYLSVTSVAKAGKRTLESKPSPEVDNNYFEGFGHASSADTLRRIFREHQTTEKLPVAEHRAGRDSFVAFMEGPGALLQQLIRDTIDARAVGACAPLSTVAVRLMLAWGVPAWKAEGTFIKEYHSFVIVNIDGVEYVVDFAADQFIPGVSPVVVPRDYRHLNDRARLTTEGQPVYEVAKLYAADKSDLAPIEAADVYRHLMAEVLARYGREGKE